MSNEYHEFESKWTLAKWQAYCPNLQYRIVKKNDFPDFLPPALTDKFNCAMVVASGSNHNQTFVFQGYRVDGQVLDEHQYIVSYDIDQSKCYAGFVEHPDYEERRIPIPPEMQTSMSLSGIHIDFQFLRKPPVESGSIDQLIDQGLIRGFTNSVEVQNRNRQS